MKTTARRALAACALALALPSLAACDTAGDAATGTPSGEAKADETLAASLADADELATFTKALSQAGIATVFDGPGSYTLLAPGDEAFDALGENGKALFAPDQKPVLAGVLREHILPGHLTPENIAKAIADKGGPVTMTTLGGGEVTFTSEGGAITASTEGGASAKLSGTARTATNGVIIPLGAVLLPPKEG